MEESQKKEKSSMTTISISINHLKALKIMKRKLDVDQPKIKGEWTYDEVLGTLLETK